MVNGRHILKLASCACGAGMIALGIIHLLTISLDVPASVRNVYFIIFGLLLIAAEFSHLTQVQFMLKYLTLLTTFMGRGIFSLYLGTIMFDPSNFEDFVFAIVLCVNGGFNIGLALCVPDDQQPQPLSIADGASEHSPMGQGAPINAVHGPGKESFI